MISFSKECNPSFRTDLIPQLNTSISNYDQAVSVVKNVVWDKLSDRSVGEALESWLETLSTLTAANYRSGMRKLQEVGYIDPSISLQEFALINHDAIVDRIKKESIQGERWSECTRQARAACYISFTGFLSRRFQGIIKKASPCKEGNNRTFFQVHEKVKSDAMTQGQWLAFFSKFTNVRDCLIAKIALQGGKRIGEVLSLTIDKINWEKNEITFTQSKTKGLYKETVITYPLSLMASLKGYVGERTSGLAFITKTGKQVPLIQVATSFEKAGIKANIPFKVTPHVLRASAVTFLKQQGFSDSDIMRVTGHASAEMIYAYDKSSRSENASKKVCLVS